LACATDAELVRAVWRLQPPTPVEANYPVSAPLPPPTYCIVS
jgi:hypothetical protein